MGINLGSALAAGFTLLLASEKTFAVEKISLSSSQQLATDTAFTPVEGALGSGLALSLAGAQLPALQAAMQEFRSRSTPDDTGALDRFLLVHPGSPWNAAVILERGRCRARHGFYLAALEDLKQAWELARSESSGQAYLLADQIAGELALHLARLGLGGECMSFLKEIAHRPLHGPASARVAIATEMANHAANAPEMAFRCGANALHRMTRAMRIETPQKDAVLAASRATSRGVSLDQLVKLARGVGLELTAVQMSDPGEIPVPAIVHWRCQHFAAVTGRDPDGGYYIDDPTFGGGQWVSAEALRREASGIVLLPTSETGTNRYAALGTEVMDSIYGCGGTSMHEDSATRKKDESETDSDGCNRQGLANWEVNLQTINVKVWDVPISYQPAVGPRIDFKVVHNHRELNDLGVPRTHFGGKWRSNWLGCVFAQGNDVFADCPEGGQDRLVRQGGVLQPEFKSGVVYRYYPAGPKRGERYVASYPDGSEEIYSVLINSSSGPRFFLGSKRDSVGNSTVLLYDEALLSSGTLKLTGIRDALGQITTIHYNHATDPLLVTSVSDPFVGSYPGRLAQFTYILNSAGLLVLRSIVDPVGLTSTFTYGHPTNPDFITGIDTPYGPVTIQEVNTQIAVNPQAPATAAHRAVEVSRQVELAAGGHEWQRSRYEFSHSLSSATLRVPGTAGTYNGGPTYTVETKLGNRTFLNDLHQFRNVYVYGRKAMNGVAPGNVPNTLTARRYQYLHSTFGVDIVGTVLEAVAEPVGSFVSGSTFYNESNASIFVYDSDSLTNPGSVPLQTAYPGKRGQPFMVMKRSEPNVVQLGVPPQIQQTERNLLGNVTLAIDPMGRQFSTSYWQHNPSDPTDPSNHVDVAEVRQTRNGQSEIVYSATFSRRGVPDTITDAAGQITAFTYNSYGQPLTMISPPRIVTGGAVETTVYAYDRSSGSATFGFLVSVTQPYPNAVTTFTPDAAQRVWKVMKSDGYVTTFEYDDMDRLTYVRFPDGTYHQTIYNRLDIGQTRDRRARWTTNTHNALRQLVQTVDPLTRQTSYEWCKCGSLQLLTDPKGQKTNWTYDNFGRLMRKTYLGGIGTVPKSVTYTYGLDNRVSTEQDESGEMSYFEYDADGALNAKLINENNPSDPEFPFVRYFFRIGRSAYYPRPTYIEHYYTPSNMFASQLLARTDYEYHSVGTKGANRIKKETRATLATTTGEPDEPAYEMSYDELGRMIRRTFNSRIEEWEHDSLGRVVRYSSPVGTSITAYVGATNRARTIDHPLFTARYSYYAEDTGSALSDRRVSSIVNRWGTADSPGIGISSVALAYDNEGVVGGLDHAFDGDVGGAPSRSAAVVHDLADQINTVSQSVSSGAPSGILTPNESYEFDFAGNRDKTNGVPRTHNGLNQISTPGYGYDDCGQLLSVPGGATFTWKNLGNRADRQLASVTLPSGRVHTIRYDGLARWQRIVETGGSQPAVTRTFSWQGDRLAREVRMYQAGKEIVNYFANGEEYIYLTNTTPSHGTSRLFTYTRDHLGSIREVIDVSGENTIETRYDYDSWGRRVVVSGEDLTRKSFTGHYFDPGTGLHLSRWRAYDAGLGRWLSRDPIGEVGGVNLYGYCENAPLNRFDTLGLDFIPINQTSGAKGHGHAGLIVGQGSYYTYHSFQPLIEGVPFGAGYYVEKKFSSLAEALAYAKSLGYDRYLSYPSDENADEQARDGARKVRGTDYNVHNNSCNDLVSLAAQRAGIPYNGNGHPNWSYNMNKYGAESFGPIK